MIFIYVEIPLSLAYIIHCSILGFKKKAEVMNCIHKVTFSFCFYNLGLIFLNIDCNIIALSYHNLIEKNEDGMTLHWFYS